MMKKLISKKKLGRNEAFADGKGKMLPYSKIKKYIRIKKFSQRNKNLFLYVFFTTILIAVSLYATLSEFHPKLLDSETQQEWDPEDLTDVDIFNFKTDYFEQNSKRWQLESEKARIYNKENKTVLSKIKLRYYSKGKVDGVINADSGKLENSSRNIVLTGNVKLVNSRGTTATGSEFYYNNRSGRITSKKRVTITRPNGFYISGEGFSATSGLADITFRSSVSGEIDEDIANQRSFNADF